MAGRNEQEGEEEPIRRSPVEARQGGRSLASLRVLVRSLVIAFVLLALLYYLYFLR